MKRVDLFDSSSDQDENQIDLQASMRRQKLQNITGFSETIIGSSEPPRPMDDLKLTVPLDSSESDSHVENDEIFQVENPPPDIKSLIDSILEDPAPLGYAQSLPHVLEAYRDYYDWRVAYEIPADASWWPTKCCRLGQGKIILPPSLPPFAETILENFPSDSLVNFVIGFENNLRLLTRDRNRIAQLMVLVMDHPDVSEELIESLCRSCKSQDAEFEQLVARLYLLSDIIYNAAASKNASAKIKTMYPDTYSAEIQIF